MSILLSEVCLNGFLTAGVAEAAVWLLKRGQVGRSESERRLRQTSNNDNNNTHTQKKKIPLTPAGGFTYGPTAKNTRLFLCHSYFCGLPTQAVTVGGSIDAT